MQTHAKPTPESSNPHLRLQIYMGATQNEGFLTCALISTTTKTGFDKNDKTFSRNQKTQNLMKNVKSVQDFKKHVK